MPIHIRAKLSPILWSILPQIFPFSNSYCYKVLGWFFSFAKILGIILEQFFLAHKIWDLFYNNIINILEIIICSRCFTITINRSLIFPVSLPMKYSFCLFSKMLNSNLFFEFLEQIWTKIWIWTMIVAGKISILR